MGSLQAAGFRLQAAFFDDIYKLSMIEGCLGSIRRRDALRWQDEACVLVFDFYRCEGFWRGIATDVRIRACFVCFIGMFFVGLRWGSVCEAMLVYCDDAFDLRRLF